MPIQRFKNRILLLALVVGLGTLLAWWDLYDRDSVVLDPKAQAQEPSHVVKNATLTLFDNSGERHQVLRTAQLTHTPERTITQLVAPQATLFDNQQRRWHASAERGTIDQRKHLILSDNAQIRAPEEDWQLETEQLHYDSDTAYAYSNTPVRLQQPPQHMQAQRMEVWLNLDALRLTGNVRGYHPVVALDEDSP
ncbi:LPS export ABC transporter periplasmic protein LptC [Halomonas vilamensis]|uniref:LPS export ABC transporter periplasmic protein LptC n=1 Tax=Vreelandella vilamensis TaxID=531309 RepID=A0ABU1H1B8_9GAMM|nr:LPS export ABC transporter periplasmic protein LptC [Halomonas vilamensis]MDR5898099.1 LPS export ABC transporter periplasmic protein LptC [Halomonas vilamensis]